MSRGGSWVVCRPAASSMLSVWFWWLNASPPAGPGHREREAASCEASSRDSYTKVLFAYKLSVSHEVCACDQAAKGPGCQPLLEPIQQRQVGSRMSAHSDPAGSAKSGTSPTDMCCAPQKLPVLALAPE